MVKRLLLSMIVILSFSVKMGFAQEVILSEFPELAATWESIGPNGGGAVLALTADPNNPKVFYAGIGNFPSSDGSLAHNDQAGVFKSIDNGQTWVPTGLTNQQFQDLGIVTSVIVNQKGTLYVSTKAEKVGKNGGLYQSMDGGKSWVKLTIPSKSGLYYSLFVDEVGELYVGSENEFAVSYNDGKSWTAIGIPSAGSVNDFLMDKAGNFYIGSNGGIYQSVDKGKSWKQMISLSSKKFAMNEVGELYVGTDKGVYKSSNGSSWDLTALSGMAIIALSVDKANNVYAGTLNSGVYKSIDSGKTWAPVNTGLENRSINSLLVNQDTLLVGIVSEGIYRSQDGAKSWTQMDLRNQHTFSVATDGRVLYAGTKNNLYQSTDAGNTWVHTNACFLPNLYISVYGLFMDSLSRYLYVGNTSLYVCRYSEEKPWWDLAAQVVNALSFSVDQKGALYVGSMDGIYQTKDGGKTTDRILASPPIQSLAIDKESSLYAGIKGIGVYKSTDEGENWLPTSLKDITVYSLAIDTFKGILYAGTEDGVYKSTDGAKTWVQVAGGFVVQSLLFESKTGNLYAGSQKNGVFLSKNGGASWIRLKEGLTNLNVLSMTEDDQYLYAATQGSSVFRLPLGALYSG